MRHGNAYRQLNRRAEQENQIVEQRREQLVSAAQHWIADREKRQRQPGHSDHQTHSYHPRAEPMKT
jgi:hypothetical protein